MQAPHASSYSHFYGRSLARMSVQTSESDSGWRARRASRRWTLAGSGARARASAAIGAMRAENCRQRVVCMAHGTDDQNRRGLMTWNENPTDKTSGF